MPARADFSSSRRVLAPRVGRVGRRGGGGGVAAARHVARPKGKDREIRDEPFLSIVADETDPVPAGHAGGSKPGGELRDLPVQLAIRGGAKDPFGIL